MGEASEAVESDKNCQKDYSKKFFQNHKNDKYYCDLCEVSVCKFNKSHHVNTKKHKIAKGIFDKYSKSE